MRQPCTHDPKSNSVAAYAAAAVVVVVVVVVVAAAWRKHHSATEDEHAMAVRRCTANSTVRSTSHQLFDQTERETQDQPRRSDILARFSKVLRSAHGPIKTTLTGVRARRRSTQC